MPRQRNAVANCVEVYRAQCNAEHARRMKDEHVKTVSDGENNCAVDVAEAFDQFVQDAVEAKCCKRIEELEKQNKELEEQKKKLKEQKKKLEEQKKQLEEDAKTEKCCAMAAAIIANEKLRNTKQGETLRKKTHYNYCLEVFCYLVFYCCLTPEPTKPTIVVGQPVCYYHPTHSVCTTVWSTSNVMPTHWLKCRPLVEEKRLTVLATYLGDQLLSTGERVLSVMNAVRTQTTKLVASNQKVQNKSRKSAIVYVMPRHTSFFFI
jgi:hypothetical protein